MNKKLILLRSIFAVMLLLSLPSIPAVEIETVKEYHKERISRLFGDIDFEDLQINFKELSNNKKWNWEPGDLFYTLIILLGALLFYFALIFGPKFVREYWDEIWAVWQFIGEIIVTPFYILFKITWFLYEFLENVSDFFESDLNLRDFWHRIALLWGIVRIYYEFNCNCL